MRGRLLRGADAGGAGAPSIALGRIPCQTASQAGAVIDKIIAVEDSATADWGSWRNTMLFVADDDIQKKDNPPDDGIPHTAYSEECARITDSLWPSMTIQKVYLFEYPFNANNEKPEAAAAIVNTINSGVGYVNFFGHGSPEVWTDQHVLTDNSVPLLTNVNQYPIVAAFSCSEGEFDIPNLTSLSELLIEAPRAGALATYSATREASAQDNENLAKVLYASLFDSTFQQPFGMAIIQAEAQYYCPNTSFYSYLGDPSLRMVPPPCSLHVEIHDMQDHPLKTLKALQHIKIVGTVCNHGIITRYGTEAPACVNIGIYNPQYIATRKDGGSDTSVRYDMPGAPVFCGKTQVTNGQFQQTTVLPRNLSFNDSGVKLLAYAWEGPKAAIGMDDSLLFSGTDTSGISSNDTTGPVIRIRPVYDDPSMRSTAASFADQVTTSLPAQVEIVLQDPNGINVIGTGPDEGLTMEVPGFLAKANINSKFQFAQGDYRNGNAVVSFLQNSLKTGNYTLRITAQNLLGNISRASFGLIISDSNSLTLDHVFNAPNPMRMGETTRFFYYPSMTTTQNVLYVDAIQFVAAIKIYSLSGRLLKVIPNARNGEIWDGRDQTGYQLPPDIYLYQVSVTYPNGTSFGELGSAQSLKSKIQKLVIYPPRR